MAVELIISRSEINSRKSNRLYDKTYNEAKRQALQRLHTKKQVLSDTPEMQEYEAVRKKLSANENVAARLNETWAKERQMEILLAASKSAYEQLPGRHRHDWIRNGIRYGIIPFIIFCMVCITWIPFNLSHGNYLQNIGSYVAGLLTLGIIIVAAGYLAGYYAAKLKDTRNKGEKGLNTELKHLENLIQSREGQLLELRKSRRNYQLLLDERKELLEEINEKERRAEKLYYEIKIIDKACQALGEKDNSAN
jgi:hypothetical protein